MYYSFSLIEGKENTLLRYWLWRVALSRGERGAKQEEGELVV